MTTVLWSRLDGSGHDRCTLESSAGGFRISGTTLWVADGTPFELRYSILTDPLYRTTTIGAHVLSTGNDRRMALSGDGEGSWGVADEPILDLYGAIDPQPSWTPAGVSVAIKRLDLAIGDSGESPAVCIEFPGHEISRCNRTLTRVDADTYRCESDAGAIDITTGEGGLVARYGEVWEAAGWALEAPEG